MAVPHAAVTVTEQDNLLLCGTVRVLLSLLPPTSMRGAVIRGGRGTLTPSPPPLSLWLRSSSAHCADGDDTKLHHKLTGNCFYFKRLQGWK